MDLRYAVRRLLYALIVAALVNALLTGLLCPVTLSSMRGFGHLSWESVRTEFRPLWRLEGLPVHRGWLGAQVLASLFLGFAVWFVWPQFRPPPPPGSGLK